MLCMYEAPGSIPSISIWTSLVAQMVKHLPAMQKIQVQSLGWEDPLEKEMATHSSTLAWKIPWMKEHGRLQSMGCKESYTTEQLCFCFLYRYASATLAKTRQAHTFPVHLKCKQVLGRWTDKWRTPWDQWLWTLDKLVVFQPVRLPGADIDQGMGSERGVPWERQQQDSRVCQRRAITLDPKTQAGKEAGEDVTWARCRDQVARPVDCRAGQGLSQSNSTGKTRFHISWSRQRTRWIESPHQWPLVELVCWMLNSENASAVTVFGPCFCAGSSYGV